MGEALRLSWGANVRSPSGLVGALRTTPDALFTLNCIGPLNNYVTIW